MGIAEQDLRVPAPDQTDIPSTASAETLVFSGFEPLLPPPAFLTPSRLYASRTGLNVCTIVINATGGTFSAAILESRLRNGIWENAKPYEVLGSGIEIEDHIRNRTHKLEAWENCMEFPSRVYEVASTSGPYREFVHQTTRPYEKGEKDEVVLSWNFQLTPAGPLTLALFHGMGPFTKESLKPSVVDPALRQFASQYTLLGLRK